MISLSRKDEYSSLNAFLLVAFILGEASTRDPSGRCRQHDMDGKVSLLVYEWPFKRMQHLVCEWVEFSKFEPNLDQIYTRILNKLIFEQNYGLYQS